MEENQDVSIAQLLSNRFSKADGAADLIISQQMNAF